ncbi:MAG: Holliday junction branch migration protein RuvA [Actinomycetota bacterium]
MIGWLRGHVLQVSEAGSLLLNVNGVGYEMSVTVSTARSLAIGNEYEFFVQTNVREDAINLYGFTNHEEKSFFLLLTSISGIGPAMAMAALGSIGVFELQRAIASENSDVLTTIPGVGKKTASRIVLELSGRIPSLTVAVEPDLTAILHSDIEDVLRQFGYSASEIKDRLRDVVLPTDEAGALRVALRELGRP